VRGNAQLWTLLHLKYRKHIKAGNGHGGEGGDRTGKQGNDEVIEVPLGTIAKDFETGEVLAEILADGESHILLSGGRGGLGNANFASPTNQTPRYAQPGEPGLESWLVFELKLLADVGLVGLPNAGKSTLLSVISAAKPKIADYPFTTLVPNLGVEAYRNERSFVVADIPGIIEGAHQGKGLGLRFLRHIERNSILLFVISAESQDYKKEYELLVQELSAHNPYLGDKRHVLAISKCDLIDNEIMEMIRHECGPLQPVFFSALTGQGIQELKDILWGVLQNPRLD
jgi:GTP-binding protein